MAAIGVQSFPELYTMLMGWNLYGKLWNLITSTGLAYLPFIGIVLRNIGKPYESQEAKDATGTSIRRMEIDFATTILIIMLGVAPFIPLNASVISYTPVCLTNGQNNTYHPGDTQTTWDTAFTIPTGDIRVPLWWYAIISISEGFASSANTFIGCNTDLRKMVSEVDMTQIKDPELKQELQQFELDCYIPARTQYLQDSQTNADSLYAINNDRTQYGDDDTEWLGSHSYQETYYQNLKASQPVKGFQYDAASDINADTHQENPPAYGTPSCANWWSDSSNGLKNRLYSVLPKDFGSQFDNFFKDDPKGTRQDDLLKRVISNNASGYQKANDTVGDYGYSHVAEALGSWYTQLTNYPKLYAAAQSAPIIQALLLLMVYTFLPFALVFSSYRPIAFISGAIIIFSLIFWSFIWHLVSYVDTALMDALYGDSWFSKQSASATLADMITGTLIIIAPLFWFSFMGAMGIAAGDVVGRAFSGMNQVGEQSATEGAELAKSAASAAAGKIFSAGGIVGRSFRG